MPIRSILLAVCFALVSVFAQAAELYMSAGKTIYRFNDSGQMIGQANIDVQNYQAEGLAIGPDNRLYAAVAFGNHRVDSFSLDLSNHVTGYVGNGQAGLLIPFGIAFGPDGNLYVANNNPGRIERFFGPASATPGANDPLGANPGARWASVTGPVGLAFTPNGTLYASAQTGANGTIYRFDSGTGAAIPVATDLQPGTPVDGIAINAGGTSLFVRDSGQLFKYTINPDQSLTKVAGFSLSYPAGGASGLGPYPGIAFGPDGFLYAATRTLNGVPGGIADYVLRINPNTGVATTFVQGNINTYTNTQSPTFLVWVPEPSTLVLASAAGIVGICLFARGRRQRVG